MQPKVRKRANAYDRSIPGIKDMRGLVRQGKVALAAGQRADNRGRGAEHGQCV